VIYSACWEKLGEGLGSDGRRYRGGRRAGEVDARCEGAASADGVTCRPLRTCLMRDEMKWN
jgi:hypothetical protein